jgi:hypothetical protein
MKGAQKLPSAESSAFITMLIKSVANVSVFLSSYRFPAKNVIPELTYFF